MPNPFQAMPQKPPAVSKITYLLVVWLMRHQMGSIAGRAFGIAMVQTEMFAAIVAIRPQVLDSFDPTHPTLFRLRHEMARVCLRCPALRCARFATAFALLCAARG